MTKSKLSRLVEIIEERLKRTSSEEAEIEKTIIASLKNGREFKCSSLEKIFKLDNGPKNRIIKLEIDFNLKKNSVRIIYRNRKNYLNKNISVEVVDENMLLANETLGLIEEQIERTIKDDIFYKISNYLKSDSPIVKNYLFMLMILFLLLMTTLVGLNSEDDVTLGEYQLTQNDVSILNNIEKNISNREDKVDYIYNFIQIIKEDITIKSEDNLNYLSILTDWKIYFILIPILVIIGIFIYIILYCYPEIVFAWGDMEEKYNKIKDRRSFLWKIIISSFLVGILVNGFVIAVTSYL